MFTQFAAQPYRFQIGNHAVFAHDLSAFPAVCEVEKTFDLPVVFVLSVCHDIERAVEQVFSPLDVIRAGRFAVQLEDLEITLAGAADAGHHYGIGIQLDGLFQRIEDA